MTTKIKIRSLASLVAVDALLLAVACLIPAASHWLVLPLYMLNPMLAILLAGMLIGRDWRNSLVLALLLPAVSHLITGMPDVSKMVCMMAELAVVATLFGKLSIRWTVLPTVFVSILAGKVVYYLLKALLIAPAVLVETDWRLQLLTVLLWGGLFASLHKILE